METLKSWILAARLRTLPLSVSGILVGTAMAENKGYFDLQVFIFSLLTTIGFQVLSNFANDYGDGVKGTDNSNRVGPKRALQSGLLSAADLKKGMVVTGIISLITACFVIYFAFGNEQFLLSVIFFVLGIAAIVAAITYTVGRRAYGYRAMGDLFVFLFFGLLSVLGSYFLYAKQLEFIQLFPAISIGLLSVGVLHLNNMRDREADAKVGKRTVAVVLGAEKSMIYHYFLLIGAFASWLCFLKFNAAGIFSYLSMLGFIPVIIHLFSVRKRQQQQQQTLDPELKKIALATFFVALLYFTISFL